VPPSESAQAAVTLIALDSPALCAPVSDTIRVPFIVILTDLSSLTGRFVVLEF
jgi:hypothetical protein